MAIQRKAKKLVSEEETQAFINQLNVIESPTNDKTKEVKRPVALRFDNGLLTRIDAAARGKGISRNAWISFQCAAALEKERFN